MSSPEQQLLAAFEADERSAPDPAEVILGVRSGIARRRRHRRYAAVGTAVAVVGVLGVIAVSTGSVDNTRPPAASPPSNRTFTSTLEFGWLPDGLTKSATHVSDHGEGVGWGVSATTGKYLTVSTRLDPRPPRLDLDGWTQVEINGKAARLISRPTRTLIDFQLPSGHWAKIEYGWVEPGGMPGKPDGPNHQPDVETAARRIANEMRESGSTELRVGFTPTYLPAGLHISGIVVNEGQPTGFGAIDTDADSPEPAPTRMDSSITQDGIRDESPPTPDTATIGIRMYKVAESPGAGRIPDIQGHPAYSVNHGSGLLVTDFHGGALGVMWYGKLTGQESDRAAELAKVAEGVRWTAD